MRLLTGLHSKISLVFKSFSYILHGYSLCSNSNPFFLNTVGIYAVAN
jgi:hypothetical protein